MNIAEGHNQFYLSEELTGARAYIGAEAWGINFRLASLGRTALEHTVFGITPEDGQELAAVTDLLLSLTPETLKDAVAEKRADAKRTAKITGHYREPQPGAPLVYEVKKSDDNRWTLLGGDLEITDEEIGGLQWSNTPKEQLLVRVNHVDAIIFRPEAFKLFTAIAGNKPNFPKRTSIWDRTTR